MFELSLRPITYPDNIFKCLFEHLANIVILILRKLSLVFLGSLKVNQVLRNSLKEFKSRKKILVLTPLYFVPEIIPLLTFGCSLM